MWLQTSVQASVQTSGLVHTDASLVLVCGELYNHKSVFFGLVPYP